jgi:hypothetical protein
MAGNLNWVHKRLFDALNANFPKPMKINGIVDSVNAEDHSFIMKTIDGQKMMECITEESLANLNPGVNILIRGYLKLHPRNTGKMYIAVEYMYVQSQEEQYKKGVEMYNKLYKTLDSDQCKKIIKKLTPNHPPTNISNIGLIVLPDNDQNLENFKISFREKCQGKLFIYRSKNSNLDSCLRPAVEYFKKYHKIDIVCLLTNELTTMQVCQLSSKENVKYLLNRKEAPYIISILSNNRENIMLEPLTALLSNKTVRGISAFTEYIATHQIEFKQKIMKGIEIGKNLLEEILQTKRQELSKLQFLIEDLADPRFYSKNSTVQLDKLKQMLVGRIAQEKESLYRMRFAIMNNIIEDMRLQKIYPRIIESEKQIMREKKITEPEKPINSNIELNADADEFYSETKLSGFDSFEKKIENKTADSTTTDILSINIQRANGDI